MKHDLRANKKEKKTRERENPKQRLIGNIQQLESTQKEKGIVELTKERERKTQKNEDKKDTRTKTTKEDAGPLKKGRFRVNGHIEDKKQRNEKHQGRAQEGKRKKERANWKIKKANIAVENAQNSRVPLVKTTQGRRNRKESTQRAPKQILLTK